MADVAVIGVGRMGSVHARNLKKKKVKGAKLVAICDVQKQACSNFCEKHGGLDFATFLRGTPPRCTPKKRERNSPP